jgi:ATP phosphoribosyltransferase regulatory subunit
LHQEGKRAVIQDINGVKNLDAYTHQFEDTTFLLGKAGKGPAQ